MGSIERNFPVDIHATSLLAATFNHPSEVLSDPILSAPEKRCVLAAWASDAFAVEENPWLRKIPGSPETIPLKEILSALRRLDGDDDPPPLRGGAALRMPMLEEPADAVGF